MSFETGLVDRLTKGLEDRLQNRRAQQQQQQQMNQALQQQQLLFEQQMRQQQQAQPQRFQMMEDEAIKKAEIEKKIREDFSKLPAVDDQEYLAAMKNNDLQTMMKKAAENPKLAPHLEQWWKMVGEHSQMIKGAAEKEKMIQSEKTKGYAERLKLKPSEGGTALKSSKAPKESAPGKLTEVQRTRLRFLDRDINRLKDRLIKEELYTGESFNPSAVSMLRERIAKAEKERESLLSDVSGKTQTQVPGITPAAKEFLAKLNEIKTAISPK